MRHYTLIIAFVFGSLSMIKAQSVYNYSEGLSIGSNIVFYAPDSIVNNGVLINNGDIQIGGIWQNNSQYEPGVGQLTLISNLPQIINHNNQSFTRLTIDGGGVKTFGADIHIENELDLTSGILLSANDAKIIIEAGANIVGGSENSYISGWLYHTGIGQKSFPIGTEIKYLPVSLEDVKGQSPVIGFNAMDSELDLSFSAPITAVSSQYYWENNLLSGTFEGSRVTLPVIDEFFLDSLDQAVVAEAETLTSDFETLGVSAISGDELSGSITSDSDFQAPFITIARVDPVPLGEIVVYNAVSPNNDGQNDIFKLAGITEFENNLVTIYSRWGDKVYQTSGYDNVQNVFRGQANVGKTYQLPEGTYYYVVDKGNGSETISGYLELRF